MASNPKQSIVQAVQNVNLSQGGNMVEKPSIDMGIASLVLGIISIVLIIVGFYLTYLTQLLFVALITSIVGIIFGRIQLKRNKNLISIVGLIINIVGLLIPILFIVLLVSIGIYGIPAFF